MIAVLAIAITGLTLAELAVLIGLHSLVDKGMRR